MDACDCERKGNLCRTSDGGRGSRRSVKPNGAASGCCYDAVSPNPISDTAMEYYEILIEKLGEGVEDWRNYAASGNAASSKPIPQTESESEILGEFVTCLDRSVRFWRLAVAMELLMIKYAVISYEIQNKNKRCEHYDDDVQLIRRPIANRQQWRSFKLSDQRLRRPIASNQDWELLKAEQQQLMMMMDD